jgi:hypothetical protein
MSEDITAKLDRILDRIETGSRPTKEDVLKVIGLLTKECPEDKVLLLQTEYIINNYWHIDRKRIKENLHFVLNYFNIIRDKSITLEFRKTRAIKVEGYIAKELFEPKNKDKILSLLGEHE